MKKTLLIFLVLCICLFALWSCGETPSSDSPTTDSPATDSPTTDSLATDEPTTDAPTTDSPVTDSPTADGTIADASTTAEPTTDEPVVVEPFVITNAEIKLKQVYWDGFGYSTKTIPEGELTMAIINELAKMPEIGVLVDKISDESLDELTDYSLLAGGTMWLEVASQIYRLSPDLSSGCHVATHLGEGYVINLTDEFRSLVNDAWSYYPYNYYKGEYIKATGEIKLERAFAADSTIQIGIKNIEIQEGRDINKITLGLVSTVSQTVEIILDCKRSDDNLGIGDCRTISFSEGAPREIELSFTSWDNASFWIYILADNTRLELEINTRDVPDYDYSDILIGAKNSTESITPRRAFARTQELDENYRVVAYANGLGYKRLFDGESFDISDLPVIAATDELTVTKPDGMSLAGGLYIYDLEGTPYKYDRAHLEDLHLLPAGEYVVRLIEIIEARDGDETYFRTEYDNVFRLVVPERVLGDVSHSLSFNDTSLILDDYFDINATYRTGERVELPIELLFDVSCRAFANGEEIPRLTDSFDYGMVFVFFMPDEDVYIEIQVTDIPGSPL